MPQITVYIRKDDLSTWKAIEKKSAWLHAALQVENLGKRMADDNEFIPTKTTALLDTLATTPPQKHKEGDDPTYEPLEET